MPKMPTPAELLAATPAFPDKGWMDVKSEIRPGNFCYPAKPDTLLGLGFKRAHAWAPEDQDWNLPSNWEDIMYNALKERLDKHRSLKVFMDVCVRCGACADKCHFFLGTNDPKNMPVLRAELLRSVYRKDFTLAGRLLGKVAGDFIKTESTDTMTAPCKKLLGMVAQGNYTEGTLDSLIQKISSDPKVQATLQKRLKGTYNRDKATLIKVGGLPEQEASDWAYLAAEVINWEWLTQVLRAAGWQGSIQEAVDIIRAAVIVEESIKVGVEAEQPPA